MIRAIKFVTIYVTDQDRSLAFFTEKLGFKVATNQPFGEGQRWIELKIPGADTRVVLFPPFDDRMRPGGFTNITFLSDDVEGTFNLYRERGVEFIKEPTREEWGVSAIFRDPDDNQFLISSR